MKKTDVKKTERSKEFLAEEWLEIVLKGQDKGEGRFCRYGVCESWKVELWKVEP